MVRADADRRVIIASVFAAAALALLLPGCSERSGTAPQRDLPDSNQASSPLVVSAPQSAANGIGSASAQISRAAAASASSASDSVVYVSLLPGTVPDGLTATIRNRATARSLTIPVVQGGFDPVPLPARVGDSLAIVVNGKSGVLASWNMIVPRRRPPRVVRTDPPHGKTAVPLNTRIGIIFSEPMDSATLTPGTLQLTSNGVAVAGTVQVDAATGLAAEVVPTAQLAPNAVYRLVITPPAQSRAGEALEAPVIVDFTTASAMVTAVTVEPETASIAVREGLGLLAVVTLSDGSTIIGGDEIPVTWRTSNPLAATVGSTTGVVSGVAAGTATITATVNGISGTASISVIASIPGLAMSVPRTGHTATLLPDGRVLIFGGVGAEVRPQAEVYDPTSRAFSPADDMIAVLGGHPAAVLPGSKPLFLDGIVLQDGRTFFAGSSGAEIYDPASGTFAPTAGYAQTPFHLEGWATKTLLLDGRVLLTGWQRRPDSVLEGVTQLFDPKSGSFSATGEMHAYSDLPGWGTLLADGTVLFVQWNFNFPPDDIELYDPVTGTFRLNGQLNNDYEFSRAVRLPDGRVLITGGQMPGGNGTAEVYLYLPTTRSFVSTANMALGRHQHTATLLRDGSVLITGGYSSWPVPTARAEIYTPPR